MKRSTRQHDTTIREQFSKQAIPFTRLKGHLDSVDFLIEFSGAAAGDTVLDVGCGPGIVACAFAKVAEHVTGVDLTAGMIAEARKRQLAEGLDNLRWEVGSARRLSHPADSFSLVLTRYTFHHFIDPREVLAEMIRVCKPGGRVLIADPVLPAECVDAYNQMEKLRDPSHTRAVSTKEFDQLLGRSGLNNLKRSAYTVPMELERQLAASFPNPGDEEKLRELFLADLEINQLGLNTRRVNQEIWFDYPIPVYVGTKAAR